MRGVEQHPAAVSQHGAEVCLRRRRLNAQRRFAEGDPAPLTAHIDERGAPIDLQHHDALF